MVLIKALLTGLVGGSLCMADITGKVTDTGGTIPIPGAAVRLEKGGPTAITGDNGHFTLATTAIRPGNGTLFPNGLSVRISNNLLSVTIPEQSAIEVATFDLTGKALATVRKTLAAGNHSLALPYRGAGIYLYRVKTSHGEFMLKGTVAGEVSSGHALFSQSSSSKRLSKQTLSTAAINDILTVTKPGYLNYRVVAYNSDTTGIVIKMIASAGTVSDTDGNVYQTVRIGNQIWTVENVRMKKYNDGSAIPLDTSTVTWNNATTPACCFHNNTTDADSIRKYGALYNWYVVSPANPKRIAPAGWHVPTDSEWTVMVKYMVHNGYNWDGTRDTAQFNKISKSLAAKTDWYAGTTEGTIGCDLTVNNSSGFSALPGGFRNANGSFVEQSGVGCWWSATEFGASDACKLVLGFGSGHLYRDYYDKSYGFSVRLVKDN